MIHKKFWCILGVLILTGCNLPLNTATAPSVPTASQAAPLPTQQLPPATTTAAPTPANTPISPPASAHFQLSAWQPSADLAGYSNQVYSQPFNSLPVSLEDLANPEVIANLTAGQLEFFQQNGFVILPSDEEQFSAIRDIVALKNGQPFFLSTDNAYHALHVTFDDLLKTTERDGMHPVMIKLIEALYQQVQDYLQFNSGTSLESDLLLSRNYLAVAWKLFDPQQTFAADVESAIAPQLAQIAALSGKEDSALIPGLTDDYGSYRPVGHYAGTPELEAYFQGMTWLGRVAFPLSKSDQADVQPSRAPLILTLALREAKINTEPAEGIWTQVYEITNFMVGPSDDPGPIEINALMENIYGADLNLTSLADEEKWSQFLQAAQQDLPAPQINSTFQNTSLEMAVERDWRFMGQRFTLDGLIFQQLISDKVQQRFFPSGLDLPAAYGSQTALDALDQAGESAYGNYPQQMEKMQSFVASLPVTFWTQRFYSSWQYAFLAQVSEKSDSYPLFMSTTAWGYKDINSLLGSWTELKHDTILYSKMPEGLGGGGAPFRSPSTPSFVEPNPEVFQRLSFAANTLYEGLSLYLNDWGNRGWLRENIDYSYGVQNYLSQMQRLGTYFQSYAQIAAKELSGEQLSAEDYDMTQYCLDLIDCMYPPYVHFDGMQTEEPIPLVAAVSGWEDEVLEAAVGNVNRILVAVPLNGQLQIAQGGVFSYYEFKQPRSDRLTDEAWREMLANDPPDAPFWYENLLLPGGKTNDVLAFRIGDIYYLTEEGYTPPLNLRSQPSNSASVLETLGAETFLEIIAGPHKQGNQTWWQVRTLDVQGTNNESEGWVLENQDWYARYY
jgi:hypothetical protein